MARVISKKKYNWAKNRNVSIRGKRLNYNYSQQLRYKKSLEKLVRQMTGETKRQINKLMSGGLADEFFDQQEQAAAMDASIAVKAKKLLNKLTQKFQKLFDDAASPMASKMLDNTTDISESNLHASLKELSGGLSLKTGVVPEGMEEVSQSIINENVALIKSIPQEYLKNVSGAVMRSISVGSGVGDIITEIQKYSKQTERRVKNIALDQTRKAYNAINKQRLQSLGVKQFEWLHSNGGQTPRESHQRISGRIFSFENLVAEQVAAGVTRESDQGLPGYPINCRCTMTPVIRFGDEEE